VHGWVWVGQRRLRSIGIRGRGSGRLRKRRWRLLDQDRRRDMDRNRRESKGEQRRMVRHPLPNPRARSTELTHHSKLGSWPPLRKRTSPHLGMPTPRRGRFQSFVHRGQSEQPHVHQSPILHQALTNSTNPPPSSLFALLHPLNTQTPTPMPTTALTPPQVQHSTQPCYPPKHPHTQHCVHQDATRACSVLMDRHLPIRIPLGWGGSQGKTTTRRKEMAEVEMRRAKKGRVTHPRR
jgi:hypothetical protein